MKRAAFVIVSSLAFAAALLVPLSATAATEGPYTYTVSGGQATITAFDSAYSGALSIPATLGGYPVTTIGFGTFKRCFSLTSVTIPTSVTHIGEESFNTCSSLVSVTIPNSVTTIDVNAFANCTALTSVTIPSSVTFIALYAFYRCTALTSVFFTGDAPTVQYGIFVSVPATVYYFPDTTGWGATFTYPSLPTKLLPLTYENNGDRISITALDSSFAGHLPLPSILDGVPVTSIGIAAFSGCAALTSVTIPDSVTSIGDDAFRNCTALASVFIGSSVASIGNSAFYNCTALASVTIPDSVTSIGEEAFYGCTSLTSVTIPAGIASVGPFAFSGCTALAFVTWDNELLRSDWVFDISLETIKTLTIGDSVTSVGDWAFSWCASLASVTVPTGVTYISYSAFLECASLTNITVDAANPVYASPGGVLFNKEVTILHRYPAGKTGAYTIPDSVDCVDFNAFSGCASLTSVTIPTNVTSIGEWAFADCTSLTSVTIPDSVASMGSGAFDVCTSLTHINVHPDNPAYASLDGVLFDKSQTALLQYPSGKTGAYSVPDGTVFIESPAFRGCALLTSVTLPASVELIYSCVFSDCASLSSVLFSGDAPLIAPDAFIDTPATLLYYLPGTTGWSDTIADRPAVCWNPAVSPASPPRFATGQFGFTLTGNTNIPVRIEATTNLASAVWTTVTNTTIPASGTLDFSDTASASRPARFYRLAFPQ